MLVRRSLFSECVAFGGLLGNELLVDPLCLLLYDGLCGLRTSGQNASPAAIGEVDDEAAAGGLDGSLVNLVAGPLSDVEGDAIGFSACLHSSLLFRVDVKKWEWRRGQVGQVGQIFYR